MKTTTTFSQSRLFGSRAQYSFRPIIHVCVCVCVCVSDQNYRLDHSRRSTIVDGRPRPVVREIERECLNVSDSLVLFGVRLIVAFIGAVV